MTTQLIDGKLIAQQVREEVGACVAKRTPAGKMKLTLRAAEIQDPLL
jgi:hypothetical protein